MLVIYWKKNKQPFFYFIFFLNNFFEQSLELNTQETLQCHVVSYSSELIGVILIVDSPKFGKLPHSPCCFQRFLLLILLQYGVSKM